MCACNDETYGAYKSALQESVLNAFGYLLNIATGTSGLTLENIVICQNSSSTLQATAIRS